MSGGSRVDSVESDGLVLLATNFKLKALLFAHNLILLTLIKLITFGLHLNSG